MHRTLKEETTRPPAADREAQQRRFDSFRKCFNEERPHEALGQRPPAAAYEASPRAYPERLEEIEYPGHYEVRSVRSSGEIKWQGQRLFVTEVLIGERVGLEETADGGNYSPNPSSRCLHPSSRVVPAKGAKGKPENRCSKSRAVEGLPESVLEAQLTLAAELCGSSRRPACSGARPARVRSTAGVR
jgi:hypothetical protein